MLAIGVLVSGRGSNLQALIDAVEGGPLKGKARIAAVVSNVASAHGLERARKHGIPAVYIDHRRRKREDFEAEVASVLDRHGAGLVVLAGFMRLLTPFFIRKFTGRLINIHPALLPSFPGMHAQRQALVYGAKVSGCTVHFVDEATDGGPIILQAAVPVEDGDDEERLSERILHAEHRILVEAVRLYAEGRLKVEGRRVRVA